MDALRCVCASVPSTPIAFHAEVLSWQPLELPQCGLAKSHLGMARLPGVPCSATLLYKYREQNAKISKQGALRAHDVVSSCTNLQRMRDG